MKTIKRSKSQKANRRDWRQCCSAEGNLSFCLSGNISFGWKTVNRDGGLFQEFNICTLILWMPIACNRSTSLSQLVVRWILHRCITRQLRPHIAKLFTSERRSSGSLYCYIAWYGKSTWHRAQNGLGRASSAECVPVSQDTWLIVPQHLPENSDDFGEPRKNKLLRWNQISVLWDIQSISEKKRVGSFYQTES